MRIPDRPVDDEKAAEAAKTLKRYCEENGCLYCFFRKPDQKGDECPLRRKPREYEEKEGEKK